jgi:hypothetical protein
MDNAVLPNEDRFTDLGQFLGLDHQGHDGACRAHIGAPGAVIIAEAAVKIHPGLHDTRESVLTH